MNNSIKYAEYKLVQGNITKDGHTMFMEDVVFDLNRKSYLEEVVDVSKEEVNSDTVSKYKTKPIDYTGCNEVVAEHLKRNVSIMCFVNMAETKKKYVKGWDQDSRQYLVSGTNVEDRYDYADPVPQTQYVKKASDIVKWLEDNGYKPTLQGDWLCKYKPTFFVDMFLRCGVEQVINGNWNSEWLEYK